MKYKSSPPRSLGIPKMLGVLALSLAVASQAFIHGVYAQGAQSVDDATSADPFGDSASSAVTTESAPQSATGQAPAFGQTPAAQPAASSAQPGEQPTAVPSQASLASTIHRAPEQTRATGEEYGPPNYLKIWKNPFGSQSGTSTQDQSNDNGDIITLTPTRRLSPISQLSKRLVASKLYLPERILIGESSKFTVRGPANWRVAIAMADKDEGAKPINNLKIRLGSDRKVVAIGKIPATGVLELYVATPIQGDLIGTYLFFEAAVWSKDDLSDTQIAETVPPVISKNPNGNGVQIATLKEKKRGLRFVPDASIQTQTNPNSLGSGNP